MTSLSEEGWGRRGVCRSASPSRRPPQEEKKKVEGRRGEEPPRFLPRILRKGWGGAAEERPCAGRADQWQATGPGLGWAAGPASSRPPPRALPIPPPEPSPRRPVPRPAWPQSPPLGPGGGGAGRGGAGGSPAENPPAGRAARGRGCEPRNGGSGRTRARGARPARGILGKKWPRRPAPPREGAERSRGQRSGPRSPARRAPHVSAASGRNLFVFHRASALPY